MTENSHEQQSGPPKPRASSHDTNSVVEKILTPPNDFQLSQSPPSTIKKSRGPYLQFSEFGLWRGPYMMNQPDQSDVSTR